MDFPPKIEAILLLMGVKLKNNFNSVMMDTFVMLKFLHFVFEESDESSAFVALDQYLVNEGFLSIDDYPHTELYNKLCKFYNEVLFLKQHFAKCLNDDFFTTENIKFMGREYLKSNYSGEVTYYVIEIVFSLTNR
jgi:hypothetical protein